MKHLIIAVSLAFGTSMAWADNTVSMPIGEPNVATAPTVTNTVTTVADATKLKDEHFVPAGRIGISRSRTLRSERLLRSDVEARTTDSKEQ